MLVIPFLSLSTGNRLGEAGGQRGRLGEVRAAEDTKRRLVLIVPGKKPEDEAAGRQYATKASVPPYSELTACHPPSSPSPGPLRQPPKEATPRSPRSRLHQEREPGADATAAGTASGWRVDT